MTISTSPKEGDQNVHFKRSCKNKVVALNAVIIEKKNIPSSVKSNSESPPMRGLLRDRS